MNCDVSIDSVGCVDNVDNDKNGNCNITSYNICWVDSVGSVDYVGIVSNVNCDVSFDSVCCVDSVGSPLSQLELVYYWQNTGYPTNSTLLHYCTTLLPH